MIARVVVVATAIALTAACVRPVQRVYLPTEPLSTVSELWQAPEEPRDLYHGPGGAAMMPDDAAFEFVARDANGWSPGFDVRDAEGVEWSVKLGPEAQSEVVASRILWGIGYHQPPTYFIREWSLTGAETGPQESGRFRPDVPGRTVTADWSWYENPFVGTRQYAGLVVANLILNNWDWKTSNNKVYTLDQPVNGVSRWFVVRDVGASLGRTTYPAVLKWFRLRGFGQGTRNDLPGFESQGFIERVDGDRVEFDYSGIYRDVIKQVTPADVRWACERLAALSDQQWQDAFRAGGYTPEQAARFVTKIKSKIAQGLALGQLS